MFIGSQDLEDLCLHLLESKSGGQEDLLTVLEDQSGNYTLLFRGKFLERKSKGRVSVRRLSSGGRSTTRSLWIKRLKVGVSQRICKGCSIEV